MPGENAKDQADDADGERPHRGHDEEGKEHRRARPRNGYVDGHVVILVLFRITGVDPKTADGAAQFQRHGNLLRGRFRSLGRAGRLKEESKLASVFVEWKIHRLAVVHVHDHFDRVHLPALLVFNHMLAGRSAHIQDEVARELAIGGGE